MSITNTKAEKLGGGAIFSQCLEVTLENFSVQNGSAG